MSLAIASARRKRSLRTAVLVGLAFVLCALLAELGLRVQLALAGVPYRSAETRAELEARLDAFRRARPNFAVGIEAQDPSAGGLLHPYTAWQSEVDPGGVVAYFQGRPPPEDAPVLITGGSMAKALARAQGERIAARLEREPRFAGRRVRILDGAVAGWKMPQPLLSVAFLLSCGHRPDAIVVLGGYDELALGEDNARAGVHPVYPGRATWVPRAHELGALDPRELDGGAELWRECEAARATVSSALHAPWRLQSALLGRFALARTAALEADLEARSRAFAECAQICARERASSRELSGPPFVGGEARVLNDCARSWQEAALSLHAMCARRSIPCLQVLQPAPEDSGHEPDRAAIARGYPLLRERAGELAHAGVALRDRSQLFAADARQRFIATDGLDEAGLAMLADVIAADLCDILGGS